jgi:hypothetical protein
MAREIKPLPQLTQPEMAELDGMIRESLDSLTRQEAEKTLRSDIASNAKDKFKMTPAQFNKLVNERLDEKYTNIAMESQEIADYNEAVQLAARNMKTKRT